MYTRYAFLKLSTTFSDYIENLRSMKEYVKNNFVEEEGAFGVKEVNKCVFAVLYAYKIINDCEEKGEEVRRALSPDENEEEVVCSDV